MSASRLVLAITLAVGCAAVVDAEQPRQAFTRSWEGRRVVLKQTLYTLVYDEAGRLGRMYKGRLEGLTIATPSAGMYFQFDGRRSRDPIVDRDASVVVEHVRTEYQRDRFLDVGTAGEITPVLLKRYQPGVELVIRRVDFERDRVRLVFYKPETDVTGELATTLTVQWPVPLTPEFTERAVVDEVIHRFVDARL